MPIDVLLADDHTVLRAGIRALLEGDPAAGIRVVGEAGTGDEAVNLTQRLKPDVVVMDLSMPGSGGLEATRRIAALGLDTKVLVLTMHAEEEYLIPVLEAGASGYLNKTTADSELVGAIGIHDTPEGEVELGYWIARPYWNQGFATEAGRAVIGFACNSLRLRRLVAGHFIDNPASRRVLRKLGFRPAGAVRSRFSAGRGAEAECAELELEFPAQVPDMPLPTCMMAA